MAVMKTNNWPGPGVLRIMRNHGTAATQTFLGVVIMFTSQISRTGRLPHLATVAALVITIAVGVMQSGAHLAI